MSQEAPAHPIWSLQDKLASLSYGQLSGEVDLSRPFAGLSTRKFPKADRPTLLLGIHRSAESLPADKAPTLPLPLGEGRGEGELPATTSPLPFRSDQHWWPLPLSDAYVRGSDLVASYQSVAEWPFAPQAYWRADSLGSIDGLLGSICILVSVQTSLLDTHPQISVASQFYGNELLLLSTRGGARTDVQPIGRAGKIVPGSGPCCVISRLKESALSYAEIVLPEDFTDMLPRHDRDGFAGTNWRLFNEFLEKGVIRRARVHAALLPRENDIELAAVCCDAVERLALPLTA